MKKLAMWKSAAPSAWRISRRANRWQCCPAIIASTPTALQDGWRAETSVLFARGRRCPEEEGDPKNLEKLEC